VRLVADEGGLGPALSSTTDALELLSQGIARSGLRPGDEAAIAIDVAASQLSLGSGRYVLRNQGEQLSTEQLVELIDGWRRTYPIVSVEDRSPRTTWDGWAHATRRLEGACNLGDDLPRD